MPIVCYKSEQIPAARTNFHDSHFASVAPTNQATSSILSSVASHVIPTKLLKFPSSFSYAKTTNKWRSQSVAPLIFNCTLLSFLTHCVVLQQFLATPEFQDPFYAGGRATERNSTIIAEHDNLFAQLERSGFADAHGQSVCFLGLL